jgi:hypothetical protein
MATYVWCELVCDHCSQHIVGQFSTGSHIPRAVLKEEAATKGAVFAGNDVFCCEAHRLEAQPESTRSAQGEKP